MSGNGDNSALVQGEQQRLVLDAAQRASAYLSESRERRVAPSPEHVEALDRLGGPLPDHPQDASEVLALLDDIGSPATVATSGGRYFGFVIGGSVPAALGANVLSAAWDQNAALRAMSPVAAALEDISLIWLKELLGLPAGASGGFVTGATMANFTCLAAARHALLARQGWDVESQGLFGAPPVSVIVSEESHATLRKALAMLGLGRDRVVMIPTDSEGRVRADALPAVKEPSIVCIQAGNVNSGSFDPAGAICDALRGTGSWVHVDGAFGLWAACAPARAHLMDGFGAADSWATDAHKWLNVPYDSGLAFVRDGASAHRSMSFQAEYLPPGVDRDPMHWTPESSRRARGIEIWAALKSLGRSGIADLVERTCRHAARFAERLRMAGYDVLNDVSLNQVLVSFGSDEETRRVIAGIQRDGICWCGGTAWHGRAAMRISVSSWLTDERDVELSLEAMLRVAASRLQDLPQAQAPTA